MISSFLVSTLSLTLSAIREKRSEVLVLLVSMRTGRRAGRSCDRKGQSQQHKKKLKSGPPPTIGRAGPSFFVQCRHDPKTLISFSHSYYLPQPLSHGHQDLQGGNQARLTRFGLRSQGRAQIHSRGPSGASVQRHVCLIV